jgi:hypothetical protein
MAASVRGPGHGGSAGVSSSEPPWPSSSRRRRAGKEGAAHEERRERRQPDSRPATGAVAQRPLTATGVAYLRNDVLSANLR